MFFTRYVMIKRKIIIVGDTLQGMSPIVYLSERIRIFRLGLFFESALEHQGSYENFLKLKIFLR